MTSRRSTRWLILGLVGGVALTLCDTVHLALGVLTKEDTSFFGQSRWVLPLFCLVALTVVATYRWFRRRIGEQALTTTRAELIGSSLAFVCVYACTGPLQSWGPTLAALLIVVWMARLFRRCTGAVVLFSLFLAVVGPAAEAALAATGDFHYVDPDLGSVPSWLPMIYLHGGLLAADVDGLLD